MNEQTMSAMTATRQRIKQGQRAWKYIRDANSASVADLAKVAIEDGATSYTYGIMFREWDRYASVFSALGMTGQRQARVGILGSTCAEVIFSFYGLNYPFDTPVTAEMTLYADWVAAPDPGTELFVVAFDPNGGSVVDAQLVEGGMAATRPEDPTFEGWAFAGWFVDPELTQSYDFSAPVVADLTLYAKWEAAKPAPGTVRGVVEVADGAWAVTSANIGDVAPTTLSDDDKAAVADGANATLTL